jgi:hypothetical protein
MCHRSIIAHPTDIPAMACHNKYKYQPKSKIPVEKHASLSPSSACPGSTKNTDPGPKTIEIHLTRRSDSDRLIDQDDSE